MTIPNKPNDNEPQGYSHRQATFSVEPGSKLQITINVGETIAEGKVPLVVRIEEVTGEQLQDLGPVGRKGQLLNVHFPSAPIGSLKTRFNAVQEHLRVYDLATWLFVFALTVYLLTRLIGLTRFPIYFFSDEAIQSQSIADLVRDGYKDPSGVMLPTYFRNGEY